MTFSWKTCFKVGGSIFLLYLACFYWADVSSFLGTLLGALSPLFLGFSIAYVVNILMSFYEKFYFPNSKKKAVIPVIGVVETVRHLTGGEESETVPRDQYKLVQTPQVFDVALLRRAYQQEYTDLFTDDASVVEALGEKVYLVEGNRENIKLTTPFDLKLAELLCLT